MSTLDPKLRSPDLDNLDKLTELGKDTFIETFGSLYKPEDLDHFLDTVNSGKSILEELKNPDLAVGRGIYMAKYATCHKRVKLVKSTLNFGVKSLRICQKMQSSRERNMASFYLIS